MVKFIKSRAEEILNAINFSGKKVLDLGCIGWELETKEYGGLAFIHQKIKKVAKKLVGIDINKKAIEKYKKRGFDLRSHNLEEPFNLKEKFDIIVAMEIIEHLNNPGIFLESIKRHLDKKGVLILSAPNAQGVSFFFQRLLKDKISGVATDDHTHWHSKETLGVLLKRKGFKIKKIWCVQEIPMVKSLKWSIIKPFWFLFPEYMGRNIICIAVKE